MTITGTSKWANELRPDYEVTRSRNDESYRPITWLGPPKGLYKGARTEPALPLCVSKSDSHIPFFIVSIYCLISFSDTRKYDYLDGNLALDHMILSQFGSEEQGNRMYGDVRIFQGYMSATVRC